MPAFLTMSLLLGYLMKIEHLPISQGAFVLEIDTVLD